MGNTPYNKLLTYSLLLFTTILFSTVTTSKAISKCNGPCKTLDDCAGQLVCMGGKCTDDQDAVTRTCTRGGGGGGDGGSCRPSGYLNCHGRSFPKFDCSPPVTSSTQATLSLNDFSEGGDGGSRSECDDNFHAKSERVVALSTGWYAGGSRCGRVVRITARNGRSVLAKVVDECDSRAGCDHEHAGQPPCRNNIVDGSDAVWEKLGLNKDIGLVPITWSMA